MKKSIQHKGSGITADNAHPGCMWGTFQILKYHHWCHVKRRFSHKKRLENKHGAEWAPGNIGKVSDPEMGQEHSDTLLHDSNVEEQVKTSPPATKKSMTARIKARLSEEFSKKKGWRHHRRSTCPGQLNRSDPTNHIESPDGHPLSKITTADVSPGTTLQPEIESSTPSSQNKESSYYNQNASDVTEHQNYHAGNHEKLANESMFLQEKLDSSKNIEQRIMEAKEVASDDSLNQPNDFLDANDIMNIHKELYAKIINDPGSPMAHHFHSHQAPCANLRFGKSGSFPLPASDRRGVTTSKLKQKQEGSILHEEDQKAEDNTQEQLLSKQKPREVSATSTDNIVGDMQEYNKETDEKTNNISSVSVCPIKKQGHNQRAKKHFKDLKKKIKHVIQESRDEKNPITMDAVLHKIPHGQMSSEGAREDVLSRLKNAATGIIGKESPGISYEDDATSSPESKIKRNMRRTDSLNESLDKYCQLFESSFRKESMPPVSENLKLKREDIYSASSVSKSFGRILSLPNIKYISHNTEDSSIPFSSWTVDKSTADGTVNFERNSPEKIIVGHSCDLLEGYQLASNENLVGSSTGVWVDTTLEDSSNLCAGGHNSDEKDIRLREKSRGELREPNTDPGFHKDEISSAIYSESEADLKTNPLCLPHEGQEFLLNQQPRSSIVISEVVDDGIDSDKLESLSRWSDSSLLHLRVDSKEKAEFDYVRDVLELSGFSRNEFLGMWHSDDQPVDPSVFGEVGGCLFHDPDCSGNEEGGNCSHLLLFDLINHVLMDIYERSFTYYPRHLSSLSHLHPMPVGYHVLEEVWALVRWYLSYRPEFDQSLHYISRKDMSRNDGWMNLQYDTECVGLELEDMIFDDLLDETFDLGF